LWHPPYAVSSGPEGIELCESVGIGLDPWQRAWLTHGLGETETGDWASFEVGGLVSRQNGKGEVLMARTVIGIHLLDEELITHTAHEFKTAREGFRRLKNLYLNNVELNDTVSKIVNSHGEEGIEFKSGQRVLFLARSKSSGRGFTGDCVILDEAQILNDDPVDAMLPTMSTRRHPQVWYAGTAGKPDSVHFARVRNRALRGGDPALTYLEWSVDGDDYDPADPYCWARANPAMGIRIREDYIAKEFAAMSESGFARERLSVGEWPQDDANRVIPADVWHACGEPAAPRPEMPVVFSLDVTPLRTSASIAVAGSRADGLVGLELADQRNGLEWVLSRCVELDRTWQPDCWVVDKSGPAGTFIQPLEDAGLTVVECSGYEVAQAAGTFYDMVLERGLRHTEDPRLAIAVAGAEKRPVGDAWAWGRKQSNCDISPLVAASFAVWGHRSQMTGALSPEQITVMF
jgi:phage terminase large subunit-like protein